MAKSRKIELKRRVLSKLMLLEYFRLQFFRSLSGWQSIQEGIPMQLKLLESSLLPESTEENAKKDKFPEIELWLQDQWIPEWINMEPSLSTADLRPYFYFSRERLTDISDSAKRLSPESQKIIRELFSQSEAVRTNAFKQAKNINQAEASAILNELIDKIRKKESHSDKNSPLRISIDWIAERPELTAELMTFINTLPDNELPVWIVTRLEIALKDTEHIQVLIQFFDRLSKSQTAQNPIKNAAKSRLSKMKKGEK